MRTAVITEEKTLNADTAARIEANSLVMTKYSSYQVRFFY